MFVLRLIGRDLKCGHVNKTTLVCSRWVGVDKYFCVVLEYITMVLKKYIFEVLP
jgi:hypothetical protein